MRLAEITTTSKRVSETRRLHDVTAAVPELVESVRAIPARAVILDGETLAMAGRIPFRS